MYKEDSLMAELDTIITDDDNCDYEAKNRARDVKAQAKYTEQYGGSAKVLVGRVKGKTALWSENKVAYTLVEAIYTPGGETKGEQTHTDAAVIDCQTPVGVATVLNTMPQYTWMVVDRRSKNVIATFVE